jgi:hypothetical protein
LTTACDLTDTGVITAGKIKKTESKTPLEQRQYEQFGIFDSDMTDFDVVDTPLDITTRCWTSKGL